ncbi:MAG: metallophosphoesterase [Anaerolineae bacterium]|nr:metallophosphoesterase [Anaerolineae bacterium]
MNIAVFADIHGRVVLAFKLCARWQAETGQHIDLILQAGDLGAFPDLGELDKATRRFAEKDPTELGFAEHFARRDPKIEVMLAHTTAPMVFVRGNHEDHRWLDELERESAEPLFPVDAYGRIFCLKTGVPYVHTVGDETITIIGIGRIGLPEDSHKREDKHIQPYESRRLWDVGVDRCDVLLTHDTALDSVTVRMGMQEICDALDLFEPACHFHGHIGGRYTSRLDDNGITQVHKLADLHWSSNKLVREGSMGMLVWHSEEEHRFEVVDAPWLAEYSIYTWQHVEP